MTKWLYAAALAVLLLVTLAVGGAWLVRWSYIDANKKLLNSLPAPPGAQRMSVTSNGYGGAYPWSDGWGTLATYRSTSDASAEDIVNFYLSELSSEWLSAAGPTSA